MKAKNIETGNLYKMFGEQTQDSGTATRCLLCTGNEPIGENEKSSP